MRFSDHSNLAGKHSTLSASGYHWVRYDEEKMAQVYTKSMAARYGTELHDLASKLIRLKENLPDTQRTLNAYVNDCIGFKMRTEQTLFYTYNAFGTCDAIAFDEVKMLLRIYDLKTGTIPGSEDQLYVYAAYFCLEYDIKPFAIQYDLRIYQNDEVLEIDVDVDKIAHIMSKMIAFDQLINAMEAHRLENP